MRDRANADARPRGFAAPAFAARALLLAAAVAAALRSTNVPAQEAGTIAAYKGADREQTLLAGAKKEGAVVFYSGMIVNQALRPLTEAFEKKYPFIRMTFWRADSEVIATKVAAEERAHNPVGDLIEGTGIGELAVREGIAQPAFSPQVDNIPQRLRDPRHLWTPTRMSYFSIAYNTDLVKPQEATMICSIRNGKAGWPGQRCHQSARRCSSLICVSPWGMPRQSPTCNA